MAGKNKRTSVPVSAAMPQAAPLTTADTVVPKWGIYLLLLLTGLVYSNAPGNYITFIDDDMYLLNNPYIRNFSWEGVSAIFTSFYEFNYHPLTTLTWLVEYRLFGLSPMPYHVLNVLLHLTTTWVVYRLATRLSGKELTGIIVAALFAVHPLHVETVAWLSERKGLLCGLFYFLSLLSYVKYVDDGLKKKYLAGAFLFFVAALLSKSAAVTLPLVCILIDWYRGRRISAAILEKVPFLLLSVLFGVLAIMSQKAGGAISGITSSYSLVNRFFLFTSGLAFYFVKLIAPIPLAAIHYFPAANKGMLPLQYYASLPLLLLVAWWLLRKGGLARERWFGAAFFLAVITVMLQVVPVGAAYAAERYSYVSYFGLFYIIGQLVSGAVAARRGMFTGIVTAVVLLMSVISWGRVSVWLDTDSILGDIVAKNEGNPNNYLVHYHWGEYYKNAGKYTEAIDQYTRSIEIQPGFYKSYLKRGEVHQMKGNLIPAIVNYNDAIRLDPKLAMAYSNKGWAYFEMGDKVLSIAYTDTALQLDNKLAVAYNNRGWMKLQLKDTVNAMTDFNNAIRSEHDFAKAYFNRALVNVVQDKKAEAIKDYTILMQISPLDPLPYYYRGVMYIDLKDKRAAAKDLHHAADLGSRNAEQILRTELQGM